MIIILKYFVLIMYIMFLCYRGLSSKVGFASWHMFASVLIAEFDLWVLQSNGKKKRFNSWDYIPHTHVAMSEKEVKLFLIYLRKVHSLNLSGNIYILKGSQRTIQHVENSHVVD